jgi:hypothetical protein
LALTGDSLHVGSLAALRPYRRFVRRHRRDRIVHDRHREWIRPLDRHGDPASRRLELSAVPAAAPVKQQVAPALIPSDLDVHPGRCAYQSGLAATGWAISAAIGTATDINGDL